MHKLAIVVWLTLASSALCLAADPPSERDGGKKSPPASLDDQLLDDLGGELLKDLEDLPKDKPQSTDGENSRPVADDRDQPPPKTTDQQLLDQLEAGEDIDLSGEPKDPLTRIGRQMRQVEQLIGEGKTSSATQAMQRDILNEIALLIEQMKKQQKSSSKSSRPSGRRKPGQPGGDSQRPSDKPATDSEDRIDKSGEVAVETPEIRDFIKDVWGHLPERVREQMQNAAVEKFLPKYEKLIEEYYKRLAEDAEDYP